MSKNKINENMLSRFFGDVFDNLRDGTADRIIRKVKQKGLPKDIVNHLEKLKKDRDEFEKKLKAYEKKYGENPNLK